MTVKNTIDLSAVVGDIRHGVERGLRDAVEFLLTEANKSVPHDEGTLERSGQASVSGTKGAVSYDTPYAARQHEDMTLRHDGKGRSKWLEVAFSQEAKTVGKIIATATRREVGS
jgi:hypothetical protein